MLSCRQYSLISCWWGSKWLHSSRMCSTVGSVCLLQKGHLSLSIQCMFNQVRPVLSLVSMTSLCLEFCLEDTHGPSCGLMSCICSSPLDSSHACCHCCFTCWCSIALQSSIGKLLLTGSVRPEPASLAHLPSRFSGYWRVPGSRGRRCFGLPGFHFESGQ